MHGRQPAAKPARKAQQRRAASMPPVKLKSQHKKISFIPPKTSYLC